MIVVDASVAVKWAVEESGRTEALEVLDLDQGLAAPDLIFAELANVLRKKIKAGEVTSDQARLAIRGVHSALSTVIDSAELWEDALGLAQTLDHSAYDCFYLAAATGGGLLVSADDRFLRKCRDHGFSAFIPGLEAIPHLSADHIREAVVSSGTIEQVERLASRIAITIEDLGGRAASTAGGTRFQVIPSGALTPVFASPAYRKLIEVLEALAVDQQATLVALGWLGRSYRHRDDWPRLLSDARQLLAEGFEIHEHYIVAQMAQVSRGLEKLRRPVSGHPDRE